VERSDAYGFAFIAEKRDLCLRHRAESRVAFSFCIARWVVCIHKTAICIVGHSICVKSALQRSRSCVNENLNESEACQYLGGVTPRTLQEWRRKRGLPHIKLTAKHIIYKRVDLDGWLERFRVVIRRMAR